MCVSKIERENERERKSKRERSRQFFGKNKCHKLSTPHKLSSHAHDLTHYYQFVASKLSGNCIPSLSEEKKERR